MRDVREREKKRERKAGGGRERDTHTGILLYCSSTI